jgi:hypothetical protein
MSWNYGNDVEVDKDVDINIDFDLDVDVDVKVDKDTDVDVDVDVDLDIKGNTAELTFDASAFGEHTFTQADVFVLAVENELSEVGGYMIAAVD